MKKITSILLIISSLFTLSSLSFSYCGAEKVTKESEVKSITTNEKNITKEDQEKRNEKIKHFLAEKGKCFPENKLMEINSLLHSLKDDELEIVLNVDFKKPGCVTLASIFLGSVGFDRFMIDDIDEGINNISRTGLIILSLYKPIFGMNMAPFLIPVCILKLTKNIATSAKRTKEYNYQLLLKTMVKNKNL